MPTREQLLQESPIPCDFKIGDQVTYTNEYGVSFTGQKVIGFFINPDLPDRFIHTDSDAWWFPKKPSELKLEKAAEQPNSNPYIKPSSYAEITTLTLGRNANVHTVTKKDRFLNNGLCIQLKKEIPMKVRYAGDSLVLDEQAIEKIGSFQKIVHRDSEYHRDYPNPSFEVFSIVKPDERFLVMGYDDENDVTAKKGFFLGGEDDYKTALRLQEKNQSSYHLVKIFDSDLDEVNY